MSLRLVCHIGCVLIFSQQNDGAMIVVAYIDELAGIAQLKAAENSDTENGFAHLKMDEPSATEDGEHQVKAVESTTNDSTNQLTTTSKPSTAEDVTYSVYAGSCSSLGAVQKVRDHLDSGVLQKVATKLTYNFFNPIAVSDNTCFGHVPIILGACAMSLGCFTFHTTPVYGQVYPTLKDMMLGVLPFAPVIYGARVQLATALANHGGYQPGTPIDFTDYARPPNHVFDKEQDGHLGVLTGGVYEGYFAGVDIRNAAAHHATKPVTKAELGYDGDEKLCGCCKIRPDKVMVCGRCRKQTYCNTACQRKDRRRHKHVCRTPVDAKAIENSMQWQNPFVVFPPHVEPNIIWFKSETV